MMLCIKFSSEDTSLQRLPLWLWHQNVHNALTLIAREVATQAHSTQLHTAHRHTAHRRCWKYGLLAATETHPPHLPPLSFPGWVVFERQPAAPYTSHKELLLFNQILLSSLFWHTALCFAPLYFLYCMHVESFALYFFTTFYILSLYCIFHITYFSHISRGPTTEQGWWMVWAFQQYLTGQRRRQVLFCSLFRLTFVKSELSL